jgi:hypothetical protein
MHKTDYKSFDKASELQILRSGKVQTTNSNTTLFLTSLDGKLLKTMLNNEAITEGEVNRSFSIAELPAGVYIYQLKGEANHFGKIVKQ